MESASLRQCFDAYNAVLRSYQPYWRFSSFTQANLPGTGELERLLDTLSDEQVDRIDACPQLQRDLFAEHFSAVFALPSPLTDSAHVIQPEQEYPFWLTNGIGGRKLAQITALIACLPPLRGQVLEWCAGKGHLGRLLSYAKNVPVRSVEYDASLCEQGTELARQHQISQQFVCADVLATKLPVDIAHAVALHACGQLHIALLQQVTEQDLQTLHIAPCCYHLIPAKQYQPLSAAGRQAGLELSRDDLKLAVQAQVTGGERVRRLRYTETLWRQVYQQVREIYLGKQDYRPLPSVAKHWFSGPVEDFVAWAVAEHKYPLPEQIDWSMVMDKAQQRLRRIQRLDLVRHIFRRPLEIWLILDRALYLQEQGYRVDIREFCPYEMTPRNFLLQASK